jgi:hypothetical protein
MAGFEHCGSCTVPRTAGEREAVAEERQRVVAIIREAVAEARIEERQRLVAIIRKHFGDGRMDRWLKNAIEEIE